MFHTNIRTLLFSLALILLITLSLSTQVMQLSPLSETVHLLGFTACLLTISLIIYRLYLAQQVRFHLNVINDSLTNGGIY
jgi:hypothetical protein